MHHLFERSALEAAFSSVSLTEIDRSNHNTLPVVGPVVLQNLIFSVVGLDRTFGQSMFIFFILSFYFIIYL